MAEWPNTIPQKPLAEGYSSMPQDNVLRSQVDAGPEKRRRRFTARSEFITCEWDFTAAEYTTFKAFFEDDTFDGSIEFEFPHPETGLTVDAAFREPYEAEPRADRWHVFTELELLPETEEITT